jgi:hypothetical protein
MSEQPKPAAAPAAAPVADVAKAAPKVAKYDVKYIRPTKLKALLVDGDVKIRLSGDAKDALYGYIDKAVENAVKVVIGKLPRKSKGDSKGQLSRITVQVDDIPK